MFWLLWMPHAVHFIYLITTKLRQTTKHDIREEERIWANTRKTINTKSWCVQSRFFGMFEMGRTACWDSDNPFHTPALSLSLLRSIFHSQCCSKEVCKVSLYLYLLGGIYLCLCMWKIGYNHWLHVWTQTDNAFKRIRILSKYDIYAGIVLYLIRLWLTEMHLMMPSVGMWLCQWKGGARTQPNNRCTKRYML